MIAYSKKYGETPTINLIYISKNMLNFRTILWSNNMELNKNIREGIKSSVLKLDFENATKIIDNNISVTQQNSPQYFDLHVFSFFIDYSKHSLLSREEAFKHLQKTYDNFDNLSRVTKQNNYENGFYWSNYYKGLCKYSQSPAKVNEISLLNEAENIWNEIEENINNGADYFLIADYYLSKTLLYESYIKNNQYPLFYDKTVPIEFLMENIN